MKKMNLIRKTHRLALAISFCFAAPITHASDINFSGFLSVGGGMVDDENGLSYGGYDEKDFTFDNNLLGIQASGTVSEKLTATVQLTSRSEDDYQIEAEWAYLSWQATQNSKIRVGRLRTPFYMFSDFLDVGYSYSWIAPPQAVYFLDMKNTDGIDFYTTKTLGIFDTSFQAYFGGTNQEVEEGTLPATDARLRNSFGVAATLSKDWWTLSATYHQADLWVDIAGFPLGEGQTVGNFVDMLRNTGFAENADKLLVEDDRADFASIGIKVDTGTFVGALEFIDSNIDNSLLSKDVRHFVMGGVRFGDFLVHLTASKSKDEAERPEDGIPIEPQTALIRGTLQALAQSTVEVRDVMTLGVRWDVATGAALKLQVDDIDDEAQGDQKVFSVALQTVF